MSPFPPLYLSLWIIGLWTCAQSLRSTRAMLLAVCLAELFTLGGVILWYLHLESTSASASSKLFGPLIGAIRQLGPSRQAWLAWAQAGLPLLIGGILWLGRREFTRFDEN